MEKKVYSTSGKELRTITLDDKVFGLPVNDDVIYYAITNELANRRVGTACTKTRAEVHGSNNKPYKQKGTGNARRGDKKSPITVGGGTIFGPKPRDFSYSIPNVLILKDDDAKIKQAGRNIPNLSFLAYNRLEAHTLFYGRKVIILESAVKNLSDFYAEDKEAK